MLTKTDLQAIDSIVVKRITEIVPKQIQKALKPVNKKIDLVISLFDREYIALRKRVERIEEHISIPSMS